MSKIKPKVLTQIQKRFHPIKINLELAGLYFLQTNETSDIKTFLTKNEIITIGADFEQFYNEIISILGRKAE